MTQAMENGEEAVTKQQVLRELAAIGFARATDYLQVSGGELTVVSTDQLRGAQGAAIAQIERSSTGLKVKFYDKLKALELLGKYVGLFEAGNLPDGARENNLLDALVAATGEEVKTDDLPELQQAAESGHDLVESAGTEGV